MNARWSWFNITSVVFGFAFLYLPIVLLVIYSFNESRLVTVWAGFRPSGMASCFATRADGRRLGDDPRRLALGQRLPPCWEPLAAVSLVRYTRFAAVPCSPAWSTRHWSCRK
jgi:putrescine transport system permease protein